MREEEKVERERETRRLKADETYDIDLDKYSFGNGPLS